MPGFYALATLFKLFPYFAKALYGRIFLRDEFIDN